MIDKISEVICLGPYVHATKKSKSNDYDLQFNNGVHLGTLELDVDGYYKFWPDYERKGYWSGYVLRAIADLEDHVNSEWDNKVKEFFEGDKNGI